jgi:MarR family transcriptional regulator, organic hydroperoxide resistance regulator
VAPVATRTGRRASTPQDDGKSAHPLGATLEFLRLLWAINHGLNKTSRKMQSQFGVTGQQRLVIRIVGTYPGLSAGDLARILHIHPSTLTGILQRLSERGLLRRIADPGDARRVQLDLTAKGRRLTAPGVGAVESAVKRVLARFEATDVQGTRDVLMALASGLEAQRESAK